MAHENRDRGAAGGPSTGTGGESRWLAAILALAGIVRLAYLAAFARSDPLFGHLLHDAKRYHEWAVAIASGMPFEAGPFHQAPLYPYALGALYAVAGARPLAAYALQTLLGLGTVLLVHRIGREVFGPRAALAAAAIAALYHPLVFFETKLVPASLSVFLAATLVERALAADRSPGAASWLVAGAVGGAGAVANPSVLLHVGVLATWIAADRSRPARARLARAAWVLAGATAIVSPVTIRNAVVGGDRVLVSTNGGITFYQGNNPVARGLFSAPEGFSGSIFRQREESRAIAEREAGRALADSEVSSFWFRKGIAHLAGDPLRALLLLARKAGFALDSHEHPLEYDPGLDRNPARLLMPVPFGLVAALAAARLAAARRFTRAEALVWLSTAATAAVLLAFYPSSRYRLPAFPALAVLAGGGATALLTRNGSRPRGARAAALLAAAVALASFALMPLVDPLVYRVARAMALCDLAGVHLSRGEADRAVGLYERAIGLDPAYPYAHLDLAKALRARGDVAGAERASREGARLAPALAEAHLEHGVALHGQRRLDEAAAAFAEAFRLDPSSAAAGNNLVGTCLEAGRTREAVAAWREMRRRGVPVDPPLEAWIGRLGVAAAGNDAGTSEED